MKILANAVVAGGMIAAAVMLKKFLRSHHVGQPGFHALEELDDDLRAIERDVPAHQEFAVAEPLTAR